jgi:hypothetical protein
MRYRKLDAQGDMQFGQQQADFWINQPEAVAQAVKTRLQLRLGTWFLDTTDGTDWDNRILGNRTAFLRDAEIRSRVGNTQGASGITNYTSGFEPNSRHFTAQFSLDTIYGRFDLLKTTFLIPTGPRPPVPPFNVSARVLNDTQVNVTWSGS